MAWFQSAPTHKETKPRNITSTEKEKPLTRAQNIESKGGTPLMPDVGAATYLITYWQELGMVELGGMGPIPLSAKEVCAWCDGSGVDLCSWEFKIIREMSRAYLSQAHDSQQIDCPAPYGAPENTFDRAVLSKGISSLFKSMIKAKE